MKRFVYSYVFVVVSSLSKVSVMFLIWFVSRLLAVINVPYTVCCKNGGITEQQSFCVEICTKITGTSTVYRGVQVTAEMSMLRRLILMTLLSIESTGIDMHNDRRFSAILPVATGGYYNNVATWSTCNGNNNGDTKRWSEKWGLYDTNVVGII